MSDPAEYTLHYFPFSLYSLMVRFGLVLGQKLNPELAPNVHIKLVNLHRQENLSENYLVNANPKGQVPSLTSPALPTPLNESRDIASWLCAKQPELVPVEHKETIDRLMDKLYAFHAKPLTITPDDVKDGIPNEAAAMLENPDLTEEHRRALEIKSVFHDTFHSRTVEAINIQAVEEQARDLMRDLAEVLAQRGDGKIWLFGDQPTILDAHVAALAVRLIDLGRFDLVADPVRVYADGIVKTEEWDSVTHGRTTMWNPSLGHVADLNPL